jgi:hypothetical protein
MKKPEDPDNSIGRKIVTNQQRVGTIKSIGKLSEDPWILFDDNSLAIRCSWESIELL